MEEPPRARATRLRMAVMLAVVAVILALVFGYKVFASHMIGNYMAARAAAPQVVATTVAATASWPTEISAVASLTPMQGANLSVEVAGIVESIDFKPGDDVKAGTPLIHLRAADDLAKLHALEATARLAAVTYERDKKQFAAKAVSQSVLDTDAATLESDAADVAQQQALVEKKIVRAPFAGRVGINQVNVGQYVAAGTALVTLQAVDPIYADFTLPQQDLSRLRTGEKVLLKVDTYPDRSFEGQIMAINPAVDVATRNVQIRALLHNANRLLLPGMYATVAVEAGETKQYTTLPQTAIVYNTYGDMIYLVDRSETDKDGKPRIIAKQTFVSLGPKRGDQVAVLRGVSAGQEVVSAGQVKLRNGTSIAIDNSVTPSDNPSPALPSDQ